MAAYDRAIVAALLRAVRGHSDLIHLLTGPRQVGKTTAALAVAEGWAGPTRYAAADELLPPGPEWLRTQWELARRDARTAPTLLVLDEVQKVPRWSEAVKGLWDADRRTRAPVRVLLLGSSALLLPQGVTESLAGRFLLHRCHHWSWTECRDAFGWDLDRWLFFGGYPGAAALVDDEALWRRFVRDSLIEAVLARDVLSLQRVNKPALLRHLFVLACRFPAQALSYTKMLGQLTDAGNATTLAHYLRLLETAYLASGLERFSAGHARSRGSTPKLVLWNPALPTAVDGRSFRDLREDGAFWGRLVENAVGAHLVSRLQDLGHEVTWWREGNLEVDFVVRAGRRVWAVEVKGGRERGRSGLDAFVRRHPGARMLLVGSGGLDLGEFLATEPADVLGAH